MQLSAIDSLFLGVETSELPAHVAGLQIYRLPENAEADWLHNLVNTMRTRAPGKPFNLRLRMKRLGLPELVEDKEFDIDYHLRHSMLPSPGSDEQLASEVARLHATVLDRDRPLWEVHVIEGLSDRRFAFYIKIHHAICDGATFAGCISDSTSDSPDTAMRPIWERWHQHEGVTHRPWMSALRAPVSLLSKSGDMTLGLGKYGWNVMRERFIKGNESIALPLSGPQTALNAPLSASRNLAFTEFPLAELKAMGRTVGGTINDVVLAITDAALRRYLSEQGQQPKAPLVAAVPVNLRSADSQSEGNQVTSLQVKLGKPNQTPKERLEAISASVKAARNLCEGVPTAATQVVSFGTALFAAMGSSLSLEGVMPPPINVVISNVPGPREARYFGGAELVSSFPVSAIAPMTALNVTVFSYNGKLFVGLTSARRALPRLGDLKLCFDEVYEEFVEALLG